MPNTPPTWSLAIVSSRGGSFPNLASELVANSVKPYPFVRPAITEVVDSGQAKRLVINTVKEAMGVECWP